MSKNMHKVVTVALEDDVLGAQVDGPAYTGTACALQLAGSQWLSSLHVHVRVCACACVRTRVRVRVRVRVCVRVRVRVRARVGCIPNLQGQAGTRMLLAVA